MKKRSSTRSKALRKVRIRQYTALAAGVAAFCLLLALSLAAQSQSNSSAPSSSQKEPLTTAHATGSFDVKLTPFDPAFRTEDNSLVRMSIERQFHGDLEATSKGEMLSAGSGVKGSAGYVAIERVSGSLQGRTGTFILQHNATMTRGTPNSTSSSCPTPVPASSLVSPA
jgi:hypothetical protein